MTDTAIIAGDAPPVEEAAPSLRGASARRHQAILAVAHDVFLECGYEGTSMSQVAARLGGSKGTLYSYFDSKEALFEALVADSCARNSAALFLGPTEAPLAERYTAIARAYIRLVCSDWATRMFQIIAEQARRRPEIGALFYANGPAAAFAGLASIIAGDAAAGALVVDDAEFAAETFTALCRGTLHLRRMLGQAAAPDDDMLEHHARRAVAQFLKLYTPV
jgi:AcrR family transcriptional regulator